MKWPFENNTNNIVKKFLIVTLKAVKLEIYLY